ncbi:MAG: FeoB-associated Cys-rich membrane protein [Lachnospiraceae bacterium]|nr:FeoB-associated Cys-rich membrane protein [Lachnospiraceae bacterium]
MESVIANIVIIIILLAMIGGACVYIHKEKKKGRHCIGCPYAASCPKKDLNQSDYTCGK